MNPRISGSLLTLTLAALSPAQQQTQVDPRLSKAELADRAEHDLARAAALYAEVFDDANCPIEVRADAGIKLCAVLQRQGKTEDAKAAGDKLLKLRGSSGVVKLAGPQQDDAVDAEIARLIEQVRTYRAGSDQLVWLGDRAVPRVIAAADQEPQLEALTGFAHVLLRIGGPTAEAWFDKVATWTDPLRRRAVIRAAGLGGTDESDHRVKRARLWRFGADRDAEVRMESIRVGVLGRMEDLIASLDHGDPRVRQAALMSFSSGQLPADIEEHGATRAADLLAAVLRHPEDFAGNTGTVTGLVAWFGRRTSPVAATRAWLALTAAAGTYCSTWPGVSSSEQADAVADAVVQWARVTAAPRFEPLRRQSEGWINGLTWHLSRKSMPQILELASLGVGFSVGPFVREAQPEDWAALIPILGTGTLDENSVGELLQSSYPVALPDTCFAALREQFLARTATAGKSGDSGTFSRLIIRLCLFDSDEALSWCEGMLRGGTDDHAGLADANLRRFVRDQFALGLLSGDSPARRAIRRRMASLDLPDFGASRNQALCRIVQDHDVEGAEAFAQAYTLGVASCAGPTDVVTGKQLVGNTRRGLFWFEGASDWSAEEIARAMHAALRTGSGEAWTDVRGVIRPRVPSESDPERQRRVTLCAALGEEIAHCPGGRTRRDWVESLLKELESEPSTRDALILRTLDDKDPEVLGPILQRSTGVATGNDAIQRKVSELLQHEDDQVAAAALDYLARKPSRIGYDRVAALIEPSRLRVASRAVRWLYELDPERAITDLLPRFQSGAFQGELIDIATRSLDRRLVPALIGALRSDNATYRTEAKKALGAIEYYTTQTEHWQRLLDGSGLDASSAAEALVKQARGGEKAIRIAAIRSLGTLAKPETLPMLIQLMQDQDAEIRQAAGAAVEKINAKQ
ncbi:MAG: HEAT repeat domain-containing protein [Planctomycetota bacterium]